MNPDRVPGMSRFDERLSSGRAPLTPLLLLLDRPVSLVVKGVGRPKDGDSRD